MLTRIALISEHASPLATIGGVDSGGQNIYVAQIAKHLALQGYAVDIFTRRDNPLLPEAAEWIERVRIIHVPAGPACYVRKEELLPYMEDFARWMAAFCRDRNMDYSVVHANFFMSGLVALRLRERLGIPFVITFHALGRVRRLHQREADQFPDERLTIEDQLVREADRIIAECPQDKHDLMNLYQAAPERISIIPCGVDPTEFWPIGKELARAALGFSPQQRQVLQLGRLVPRKGVDNVIRAVARLNRRHRLSVRLAIVGGDSETLDPQTNPEVDRLQRIAAQEEVGPLVSFLGRRSREMLKYFYSAADIFVTTPWYEPFGITPLEAMASGTPVIASAVGGLKFTVREGQTGILVSPKDPEALADRMAQLYQNPDLSRRLRAQALRYVNQFFTWPHITRSLLQLYRRVVRSQETGTEPAAAWHLDRRLMDRRRALTAVSDRLLDGGHW